MNNTGSNGFVRFITSTFGYILMSIVIGLILWGTTLCLLESAGEVALLVILFCAVFGWCSLNRIQPGMFIIMPISGWIIYFIVKLILSVIIGIFVAPFCIGGLIAGAIRRAVL